MSMEKTDLRSLAGCDRRSQPILDDDELLQSAYEGCARRVMYARAQAGSGLPRVSGMNGVTINPSR